MLNKNRKNRKENSATVIVFNAAFAVLLFFGLAATSFGQTTDNAQSATAQVASEKSAPPVLMPVFTVYKDIKIGATADEVRDKLGKAKIDDKDGFFYDSDGEMVKIRLDADKKVRYISVTYTNESRNAPKYTDVFGKDVTLEPSADGKIYKLVRYPEAGYWVAYSRTAGDNPTVTITMQKLRTVK